MRVGFIGWRGMVGSVLLERMEACGDFAGLSPSFFSTSNAGGTGPAVGEGGAAQPLLDAFDLAALGDHDVLICCQGGDYTRDVYPRLRDAGYDGYWIDSASALRMDDDAVLILDPVNMGVIEAGLASGCKTFVGPNCTVSLLLLALDGLLKAGHVEWITSMTYQAASGAGAANMTELVRQMGSLSGAVRDQLQDRSVSPLQIERAVTAQMRDAALPKDHFGQPLAGSLLPWIDIPMDTGQSREEWKGFAEGNKILGTDVPIPIDGMCVRVSVLRCHAQGVTVKLRKDLPIEEVRSLLDGANEWVRVVDNTKQSTLAELTPAAVTGTLDIPVGRVRKLNLGPEYIGLFTVGDQLLWGAAEPLRRMLAIIRAR